jgi:hypothetical protein
MEVGGCRVVSEELCNYYCPGLGGRETFDEDEGVMIEDEDLARFLKVVEQEGVRNGG